MNHESSDISTKRNETFFSSFTNSALIYRHEKNFCNWHILVPLYLFNWTVLISIYASKTFTQRFQQKKRTEFRRDTIEVKNSSTHHVWILLIYRFVMYSNARLCLKKKRKKVHQKALFYISFFYLFIHISRRNVVSTYCFSSIHIYLHS